MNFTFSRPTLVEEVASIVFVLRAIQQIDDFPRDPRLRRAVVVHLQAGGLLFAEDLD